jgi:hypothetical protein
MPVLGFERVQLAHLGGIVVNEVRARADANLQDFPLSLSEDPLANLPDRRRITQDADEMGVDTIAVEWHSTPESLPPGRA